ncbi:MAG: hypothetical protein ACOYT4_02065 [Nanoarchaeota archaeon]
MNLDILIKRLLKRSENEGKQKLIEKEFTYKENSKALFVVFPHWHETMAEILQLKNLILKENYSFLNYKFTSKVLSADFKLTKKRFKKIKKIIIKDLKKLEREYNFNKINFIGISLGRITPLMIANTSFKKLEKIILVAPGNCLAEALWNGILTQDIRKEFEKNKVNLEKLKKYWKKIDPENNLKNIDKKTKIIVYLSESDRIIPYACGLKLTEAIRKNNLDLTIKKNKLLGHYLTICRFLCFPEI